MDTDRQTPNFEQRFPELHQFILQLVKQYQAGKLRAWDDLEQQVSAFFHPSNMTKMELALPYWNKMASYREGVTLVHVMCVFLGLYMLPEYKRLSAHQQNLMKWIVLLHDLEKEVEKGKRDSTHAFRSAATAAKRLCDFGFPTTREYPVLIDSWSDLASTAAIQPESAAEPIQDNRKYPEILSGIDRLFGDDSAAAQIVKTVLLHMSVNVVKDWPQAAPLSDEETIQFAGRDVLPLLKVMMLADNEGWVMFYPEERAKQRAETVEKYSQLENLLSSGE